MVIPVNTRRLQVGLLACSLLVLPSSSFLLSDYLTEQVLTGKPTQAQLFFALDQHNEAALYHAWQQSKKHDTTWQLLAKRLAKTQGQVAYQLALFYQAQHLMPEAITWYHQAMRLQYSPAFVALAQYYFDENNLAQTEFVLALLASINNDANLMAAQVLNIKLAISRGQLEVIKQGLTDFSHALQYQAQGRELLANIDKYQVVNISERLSDIPACAYSIQLFATRFAHLQRLETFIKDFAQHPLNQFVCFSPVRYMAIDTLACTAKLAQSIQCNEQNWRHLANSVTTRFVGLLLPEGGANVHFGALYIDSHDNFDVFVHEISHLLGFVDEYPLVEEHTDCVDIQPQIFSENVAVLANRYQGRRSNIRAKVLKQLAWRQHIKASTPILQAIEGSTSLAAEQWLLGTPKQFEDEIGVFKGKTCDNAKKEHEFNAYTPLKKPTIMQYFSLDFPHEYLLFIQESQVSLAMPSFHYNIALAQFNQGNIEQANYWLKQSAEWESEQDRKKRILQGNF